MRSAASATRPRWVGRRGAALVIVAVLCMISPLTVSPARAAADPLTDHSVVLSVLDVTAGDAQTSSTPPQSTTPKKLTIALSLTNATDQSLPAITIDVVRGNPIGTQAALDDAIAHPKQPDPGLAAPVNTTSGKPVTTSLAARGSGTASFVTATDTSSDAPLCICADLIYPLYITAHVTDATGADVVVGITQTFVPAFNTDQYAAVRVSWLWPLVDRPHRLIGDAAFIDDELAASVAGGRLDRMLQVAEAVTHTTPLTLVLDPELIDELQVMATGPYQVSIGGKTVRGAGTQAAAVWLQRLRTVLGEGVQVSLTPYADPDVEALTRAGLAWRTQPDAAAQARIATALGGNLPAFTVAWPMGDRLSPDTLTQLVRQGASSVVVNNATLPAAPGTTPATSLSSIETSAGAATAFVTTPSIERYVAPVMAIGGPGKAALPQLVAQVAVHALDGVSQTPYLVISPPRYLDPNPEVARRAILETTNVFWSSGLTLTQALSSIPPSARGQLVAPSPAASLPDGVTGVIARVDELVPALNTMFSSTDAATVLGGLATAAQRLASTGWSGQPGFAQDQLLAEQQLAKRLDDIESGVRIVQPSSGTYTLASSNSPLPITVENTLPVPVTVQVRVQTANDLPGFTATDAAGQVIPPGTRLTLHIRTHVERTGRFAVQALLLTPSLAQIGSPVPLTVRSTALGAVGVIITVAAGAILVLALLVRMLRLLRRRRRTPAGLPPVVTE